jgi:AraC-like DNA-binding protein
MRNAGTLATYLARPVGSFWCGRSFIVWWANETLNGTVFWGRPDEFDLRHLARAYDAELAAGVSPHASLIDARRLAAVDLGAFNALSSYLDSRRAPFSRLITKQALLRPDGLAGAVVCGFYAVLEPSYPVAVFTEPTEALDWLGTPDLALVVDELDAAYSAACETSSLLVSLRSILERDRRRVTLGESAHALGLSARSLQRRLREAKTTFRSQRHLAQVSAAQHLLRETNYDLKRIAADVGCASLQHFSVLFRKVTGESPTAWRKQRVGSQGDVQAPTKRPGRVSS